MLRSTNQLAKKLFAIVGYAIDFLQLEAFIAKMLSNIPPLSLGKNEKYYQKTAKDT